MVRYLFLTLLVPIIMLFVNCESNPANVDKPPVIIDIASYSLPSTTTNWQYDFTDGSSYSSKSFFDMGNGQMGILIGTSGTDTMIIKGNSLIGYAFANGMRLIFGSGTGVLLEPIEIQDGKTYNISSTGYNQDYTFSVKLYVSAKYNLSKNVSVGSKTMEDCLYVELTLTIKDPDGNLISTETNCDFRAKGLGTVKIVDKSGTVLKRTVKITANDVVVFTS